MGVWSRVLWGILVFAAAVPAAHAATPLRRNLDAYIIFGLRNVGLKNMTVTGPGNSGVNCPRPSDNSECGVITHENPQYGAGTQIVGDVARFNRTGGVIDQLFTNVPNGLDNVFINSPPITSPNPLPILGDADGDGTPSCRIQNGACVIDTGDLAAACGFPVPFPACDPGKAVKSYSRVGLRRGAGRRPRQRPLRSGARDVRRSLGPERRQAHLAGRYLHVLRLPVRAPHRDRGKRGDDRERAWRCGHRRRLGVRAAGGEQLRTDPG